MLIDLASMLAIAAGSSVLASVATVLGNGIFGWAKGRADVRQTDAGTERTYGEMYAKMYADFAAIDAARAQRDELRAQRADQRNDTLVTALENLAAAVEHMVPVLDNLVERFGPQLTEAEIVDISAGRASVRQAASAARQAI